MNAISSWFAAHFVPMLSAWQWLLLAAIPPAIVLLYFLKLRRQPLEVPSTYLWRKSIEDLHVNSLWQRLRQNLLLYLQLLVVLLAILALLRPGFRGTQLVGDRFIFLIDNSASMNATDVADDRLAQAKQRVGELIEQMRSGDVAMLISFSDSARVEQLFTDNRRELRRRLDAIEPTQRTTSLAEALRVATGLAVARSDAADDAPADETANTADDDTKPTSGGNTLPATLYIVSDGKFADLEDVNLGSIRPEFIPIGNADAANVGITSFVVERPADRPQRGQAFVRVENYGPTEQEMLVTLRRDDKPIDAQRVTIPAGEAMGVAFDIAELRLGVLEARVDPGGNLASDDRAWAVVTPPRRANVLLVTPGNDALTLALSTPRAQELAEISIAKPEVLTTPGHAGDAAAGKYDLIIYDQCQPEAMPQANTLFVGRIPPLASWGYSAEQPPDKMVAPQVIDQDSAHPLGQLVELGNVAFADALKLTPPAGASEIIRTDTGPLYAIAPREGFEDAVLASEIVGRDAEGKTYANTDWPLRISFPVFVLNSLEYLGGSRRAAGVRSVAPGKLVELRAATPQSKLEVELPSGTKRTLQRTRSGTFNFAETDELGVYRVREEGQPTQSFAVNLFDERETDIRPRAENSIKIGFSEVAGQAASQPARRELWRPLLLVACCLLVGEWYIYHRRVYI
jgi:hypothetical protein